MPYYIWKLRFNAFYLAGLIVIGAWILVSGNPHPLKPPFRPDASFHGYACYGDCADHRAAYEWAQREGVTDVARCRHISRTFSEGCKAWVRDGAPTDRRSTSRRTPAWRRRRGRRSAWPDRPETRRRRSRGR